MGDGCKTWGIYCTVCGALFRFSNLHTRYVGRDGKVVPASKRWRFSGGRWWMDSEGLYRTTAQEIACAKRHGLNVYDAVAGYVKPEQPNKEGHKA